MSNRGNHRRSAAPGRAGRWTRTAVRGLGQTLITVAVVLALFVVYQVYVSDEVNEGVQTELTQELREDWADGADPLQAGQLGQRPGQLPLGEGFAFLRIPAFGLDYVRVVLEGTDEDKLSEGPGHYVDSALPGEVGNFAMAGHRVGRGSPFLDLDQLEPGDPLIVETRDEWYVYRVLPFDAVPVPGRQIVTPDRVDVVAPVPGDPAAVADRRLLTLTTCHPKYSARQRMIIHAELDGPPLAKATYPEGPPALFED